MKPVAGSRQHVDRHVADQRPRSSRGTVPSCSLYLRSSASVTSTPSGWFGPLVEGDREDLADPDAALADGNALEHAGRLGVADLDVDLVAQDRRRLAEPDDHHGQDQARHDDEHADPELHEPFVHDHPRFRGPGAQRELRALACRRKRRCAAGPSRGAARRPRRGRTGRPAGRASVPGPSGGPS